MKRIFCISTCVLLVFISGCNGSNNRITAITESLKFTALINKNEEYYIEIPKKSSFLINVKYPDNLKGLTFNFKTYELKILYNKLEYITHPSALPKEMAANFIYSVFSDVAENPSKVITKDNEYYISGETEFYNYKLYLGSTGLPIKITDSKNNFNIIIKNPTIIK